MKNTKLFVGSSLMVQSVAFLVLALIFWGKKKSLAKAFAAVSAAGGVASAFCLVAAGKERAKYASDCCDGCCEFDSDDILCNFEDTDLYDEEDEPESDEV